MTSVPLGMLIGVLAGFGVTFAPWLTAGAVWLASQAASGSLALAGAIPAADGTAFLHGQQVELGAVALIIIAAAALLGVARSAGLVARTVAAAVSGFLVAATAHAAVHVAAATPATLPTLAIAAVAVTGGCTVAWAALAPPGRVPPAAGASQFPA